MRLDLGSPRPRARASAVGLFTHLHPNCNPALPITHHIQTLNSITLFAKDYIFIDHLDQLSGLFAIKTSLPSVRKTGMRRT